MASSRDASVYLVEKQGISSPAIFASALVKPKGRAYHAKDIVRYYGSSMEGNMVYMPRYTPQNTLGHSFIGMASRSPDGWCANRNGSTFLKAWGAHTYAQ